MSFVRQEYNVLIVSQAEKFAKDISSLLSVDIFKKELVKNAGEARRIMLEKTYDIVIVNSPLKDEFGSRLCSDISRSINTIAVMFASGDIYEQVLQKNSPNGVFVIKKPCSQAIALQSLSLIISARERLRTVEKKAGKAEDKITELKTVNRAKWYLIDNENLSENDAHKYIERSAMENGITKIQAAQIIIEKYS